MSAGRGDLAAIALVLVALVVFGVVLPRRRQIREDARRLAGRLAWPEPACRRLVRPTWRQELGLDPVPNTDVPASPVVPVVAVDEPLAVVEPVVVDRPRAGTPVLDRVFPVEQCTYEPKGWPR